MLQMLRRLTGAAAIKPMSCALQTMASRPLSFCVLRAMANSNKLAAAGPSLASRGLLQPPSAPLLQFSNGSELLLFV